MVKQIGEWYLLLTFGWKKTHQRTNQPKISNGTTGQPFHKDEGCCGKSTNLTASFDRAPNGFR
jgi:hypothetical protein